MLCLPQASQETLKTIFSPILSGFLEIGFEEKAKDPEHDEVQLQEQRDKVARLREIAITSTIEIYTKIKRELRPTPTKFTYLFNLRDVSKVF